ncbi:MAG: WD40 repeat domain-containing serine/threonine protein kinase [Rudaea sp.]
MNIARDKDTDDTGTNIDAVEANALADLVFGSLSRTAIPGADSMRNLAFLPTAALELDLSDAEQRQFGDYELLEQIGEGGMGVVYRARQRSLDREIALKLLAAGPWASLEYIERFRREAQNAARMQHPNIVAIYEVGSAEGLHFFSMRLIHGGSLAAKIKRDGKLAAKAAATLLRTIAEAVDYAHRLGVLHLDLKPANVLLDEDGAPHVADFGLARRLDNTLAADNEEISGTPSYMAPEQAQVRSLKITAATDIWGLGAVLYEVVTGVPPFLGASAQDTLRLVLDGTLRSPRRHTPELPSDLEAIIVKCMAHEASSRYSSARSLADDLGRFVEGRAVSARPLNAAQRVERWARREPRLALSATLGTLALLFGLLTTTQQWRRAESNAGLAQRTLWESRESDIRRQITQGDSYRAIGNALASVREMERAGVGDQVALQRRRIGTTLANSPALIDAFNAGKVETMALAADHKALAVSEGRSVRLYDLETGRQRWQVGVGVESAGMVGYVHLNAQDIEHLEFSRDGRRIVGSLDPGGFKGLLSVLLPHLMDSVLIDVEHGSVVHPPPEFHDFLAAAYATDGTFALLFDKHGRAQRWRTLPWSPAGELSVVAGTNDGDELTGPIQTDFLFASNSKSILQAHDANLELRALDPLDLHVRSSLKLEYGAAVAWALDADGSRVAVGTATGHVAIWTPETRETRWLQPSSTGTILRLEFSKDGARLLVASENPGDVRVFDLATGTLAAMSMSVALGAVDVAGFAGDGQSFWTRSPSDSGAQLWRIAEQGFPLRAPVPAFAPMNASLGRFLFADDPATRLLVTSDNALIKILRLQPNALVDRRAAPMVADLLRFDGRHLVGVEGERVNVFDAASGMGVGTTLTLSAPATFAALAGNDDLVTAAGREITAWDWRSGLPRWPPRVLPNSPLHISLAARAPIAAVSTGANGIHGFEETIEFVDLSNGRRIGNPKTLRGPLGAIRLSPDGSKLLAWLDNETPYAESGQLFLVATADGNSVNLAEGEKDPGHAIIDAQFADDASIWASIGPNWNDADDANATHSHVAHWDPSGALLARTPTDAVAALTMLPQSKGAVSLIHKPLLVPVHGEPRLLLAPLDANPLCVGAVSPDGSILARATPASIDLIDISSNQRVVPSLKLAIPNHDAVQQLAFSPDGKHIVGRTIAGNWFLFHVATDMRPVVAIERELQIRESSQRTGSDPVAFPSEDERRGMRASDPVPREATPPAIVRNRNAAPNADPRFVPLDLRTIANVDPRARMNRVVSLPPQPQSLPSLPRGMQRYDGVDFYLDRAVQLSGAPYSRLDTEFPANSERLTIPAQVVAAIDVLALQFLPTRDEVGSVRLHYADGGESVLAIRDGPMIVAHWLDRTQGAAQRRIGWLGTFAGQYDSDGAAISGDATVSRSYIVRLENPEPQRLV